MANKSISNLDNSSNNAMIFRSSNLIQIELVSDYYSEKLWEIISAPTNEQFEYWIFEFSAKFREIWDSWIIEKNNIKELLYK